MNVPLAVSSRELDFVGESDVEGDSLGVLVDGEGVGEGVNDGDETVGLRVFVMEVVLDTEPVTDADTEVGVYVKVLETLPLVEAQPDKLRL